MLMLAAASPAVAQAGAPAEPLLADPELTHRLESLASGFQGDVGVYVRHLRTGSTAAIRADELFPTASLIKIPILLTLFEQVEAGQLDLEELLPYPDTLHYSAVESTDVVGFMAPGDSLPLSELAFLMMTVSDNVASLWIQALVGGGVAVNEWLEDHGYSRTRVNSRTPGREEARSAFGWGQSTPREIAAAAAAIAEGGAVSPAASEAMYRLMTKSYWQDDAISQIPPQVQVASKQGFVTRARSEVLIVNAPGGEYVLAVMTRNQTDRSYERENEGRRLIRSISRAVYEYFNPEDPWRPRR
jgi:beta-lactamase class A